MIIAINTKRVRDRETTLQAAIVAADRRLLCSLLALCSPVTLSLPRSSNKADRSVAEPRRKVSGKGTHDLNEKHDDRFVAHHRTSLLLNPTGDVGHTIAVGDPNDMNINNAIDVQGSRDDDGHENSGAVVLEDPHIYLSNPPYQPTEAAIDILSSIRDFARVRLDGGLESWFLGEVRRMLSLYEANRNKATFMRRWGAIKRDAMAQSFPRRWILSVGLRHWRRDARKLEIHFTRFLRLTDGDMSWLVDELHQAGLQAPLRQANSHDSDEIFF